MEKNARSFSWVDILIPCLVAAAIFGGVWYWRSRVRADAENVSVEYTLSFEVPLQNDLSDVWKAPVRSGDAVSNSNGTVSMGTVTEVTQKEILVASVRDGEVVFVPNPQVRKLLVRIRAIGTEKAGDGIRVGDIRVAAGLRGDFRVGNLMANNAAVVEMHFWREADS